MFGFHDGDCRYLSDIFADTASYHMALVEARRFEDAGKVEEWTLRLDTTLQNAREYLNSFSFEGVVGIVNSFLLNENTASVNRVFLWKYVRDRIPKIEVPKQCGKEVI